jgi:hypothetical protein
MEDAETHHAVTRGRIPHERCGAHHKAFTVHRHHGGFASGIEGRAMLRSQIRIVMLRAVQPRILEESA